MFGLLIRWAINAVALYLTTLLVPGIRVDGIQGLIIAALVLGIVNALLRPVVLLLTLPLTIVTLGLFALVVNAVMLYIVSAVTHHLVIANFLSAFIGALVLSVISFILSQAVVD
ncbi:MAG TPA: phage holin family protein [Solirubrobacteraceae bacterium]|nr:phage holin family protein [Solirubrobacteraceae bacterium]